ncbi:hypothetical protein D558_1113 [Bordetella holmesii 44057]|nr:hypothetical protein D558_1113 [Bordetella holmesii 44057]
MVARQVRAFHLAIQGLLLQGDYRVVPRYGYSGAACQDL